MCIVGGWVGGSYQTNKDGINLDLIMIIGLYLKIYGLLTLLQHGWMCGLEDGWLGRWVGSG